jgi:hypothetical protein
MPVPTGAFRDAQALALFSNLEENDVDSFRNNYPDFAPQKWWDYRLTLQDLLLAGDTKHLQMLLNDPFWNREPFRSNNPSGAGTYAFRQQTTPRNLWQQNQSWLREAWNAHFEIELLDILKLLTSVFDPSDSSPKTVFATLLDVPVGGSYHRGLSYLFEQRWRARFCAECKKRFVAGESKNICCSETCSHERRNRGKRGWFNAVGSTQRAARNMIGKRRSKKLK